MAYNEDENKPIGRELTVLDYIDRFPNSNHNALMKEVVVKNKEMAKKTFEKTIQSLISKGIIKFYNAKNMKFYVRVDDFKENYDGTLEKATGLMFQFMQKEVERIEKNYKNFSIEEKCFQVSYHLRNVLQTDTGFTILDSMKDRDDTLYKDEHQKNQQLVAKLLNIVRNDKDFLTVYPIVMNSLGIFPTMDYQEVVNEMNNKEKTN